MGVVNFVSRASCEFRPPITPKNWPFDIFVSVFFRGDYKGSKLIKCGTLWITQLGHEACGGVAIEERGGRFH